VIKNCIFDKTNDYSYCTLDDVKIFGDVAITQPIRDITSCEIVNSYLADGSIRYALNSSIKRTNGGSGCIKTFENLTMKHCEFVTFGDSASLPVSGYLSGDFDDVKADYSTIGFLKGRPFYGKLRNMYISVVSSTYPCVNVKKPIGLQPMIIEYCTFKNCHASGNTIIGDASLISHCNLNKIWTSSNGLGTAPNSFNIISTQFCTYVP
jgi:hypothetical protein